MVAALVVGSLLYPLVRAPLAGPVSSAWSLDQGEAGQMLDRLLTNVYRSFDMRDEEAI